MKKMGFPLLALWLGLGCGGGGGPVSNPPPLVVSISPTSGAVLTGGGVQFSSNTAVDWQVNGKTAGNSLFGTISSSGFYIAPFNVPNPNVVTITAVSQADLSKSASASLSISSSGSSWANLGPFGAFAQSRGSALVIDPTNPSNLYVNCTIAVCKSSDGGRSWHLSNIGLPELSTGPDPVVPLLQFAIAPSTSTTVYLAAPAGVFKSVDGGANWSAANNGFGGADVFVLAVDATNPAIVYAGTNKGVFRTTDGGNNWSPVNSGLPPGSGAFPIAINPVTTSTVFAGAGGVFKSTDGGLSWNPSGLQGLEIKALAIDPKAPTTIYAGTLSNRFPDLGAIFKSVDNGNTWVATGNLPNLGGFQEIRTIAVDPVNNLTVYAGANTAGVYKSTDGGASWQLSSNGMLMIPNVEPAISGFAINPQNPSVIYAATDTDGIGVYKSTDAGASWNVSNTGLPGISSSAFTLDPKTPATLYAVTNRGAFKSTDQGLTWQTIDFGGASFDGLGFVIDPITTSTLYLFDQTGVFKSTDGGLTSSAVLGGGPGAAGTFPVFMLAIDPNVPTTLYEADSGPEFTGPFSHKTVNGGQTWSQSLCVRGISSLAVAHGNSSIVYLVNVIPSSGNPVTDLLKSQDGGMTCSHAGNGLPSDPVGVLLIDPANNLIVYAGMDSQGVFKTTDGGASWKASNMGIEHRQVVKLAIDPRSSAIVYAATGDGAVFKTTNGGALWTSISTGLPGGRIHALVVDPLTSTILYVATNQGVFVLHQ